MTWLRRLLEKLGLYEIALKEVNDQLKPNQRVGIRLDISPHTFITRVEDTKDETVYVAGINEQEVDFSMPVPNQKLELHLFTDKILYKTEVVFKRRIIQPVHMWILSRPVKATSYHERRSSFRLDNVLRVNFRIAGHVLEEEQDAVTRNVSMGGLAVVSEVNLAMGTKLEVRLSDIEDIKLVGEIVWKYQRSFSDKWYYGLKFVEISEEKESLLAKHINKKLGQMRWAGLQ